MWARGIWLVWLKAVCHRIGCSVADFVRRASGRRIVMVKVHIQQFSFGSNVWKDPLVVMLNCLSKWIPHSRQHLPEKQAGLMNPSMLILQDNTMPNWAVSLFALRIGKRVERRVKDTGFICILALIFGALPMLFLTTLELRRVKGSGGDKRWTFFLLYTKPLPGW